MGEFDDLIEEFVTESREHIADIEEDLIRIEKDKEDVDAEVINRVFRAAHSIKGSAKFLDLTNIGELSHKMEDVLNLIRSGKLIPTSDVTSPLLLGSDMLKLMFEDVTVSNTMDISEHLAQLQAVLDGGGTAKPAQASSSPKKPAPKIDKFDSVPVDLIRKRMGKGPLYAIKADPGSDADLMQEMAALGEILGSFKGAANEPYVLFATIIEPDVLPSVLNVTSGAFLEMSEDTLAGLSGKAAPAARKLEPRQKQEAPVAEKPRMEKKVVASSQEQRAADQYSDEEREPMEEDEIIPEKLVFEEKKMEPAPSEEDLYRDNTSFITFSLDEEIYAVPIYMVEEIIGLQDISLLPNTPDFIKGVINLRGDIVPIMDLRLRFGLDDKEYNPLTVFLIVRVRDRVLGMVVDKVSDVLVIDPARIQQTPAFFAKISTEFIQGVYKDQQGQLVILLNIPMLIKPEEWSMRRPHVAIAS